MKSQFTSRLLTSAWNISPHRGRHLIASILQRLIASERPAADAWGDPLPTMSVSDGIAIIPVIGTLMVNVPDWVKSWGLAITDANDIAEELEEATQRPDVTMAILNIDSPGGESIAGEKLYDAVETFRQSKPIFTYSADGALICSSAYQCAAPSTAILTGKFSSVGCVGTYMVYLDDSIYWQNMGISFEVFRSGSLKAIGQEGSLTDDQRKYLQSTVDEFGARFRSGVLKYRTGIAAEDLDGQDFLGSIAARKGFTAGLAPDLASATARFQRMAR